MIYFPRDDVAMSFLDKTDSSTRCPFKGSASYYTIQSSNGVIPDAVWSYENPLKSIEEIAGYLAFVEALVTVERL